MIRTGYERPLGLALALLIGGCPIVDDLLGRAEPEPSEPPGLDEGDPVRRIDEKLGSYIRCRDSLDGPVRQSWARYAEHVDESGRPLRRDRAFIYPVGRASFRICNEVLAEAPERPPPMPEIERSALEMVDAAREYADLSREVHAYLEAEGFADDDWARLAQLHPRMRDAHERWRRNDTVLELYLDTEKAANDPKLLEILSAEGKTLEYLARAVMVRARPLARCYRREDSTADECRELFQAFDEAYQAFARAHDGPEQDAAAAVFWMRAFAADAREFQAEAARVGAQRERADDPKARAPDAETEEALLLYDRLVRDADTLDFDFP